MHFARALRSAGLPIGPGRVIEAVRAVEAAGLTQRDDFYWALHAVFVNRRDQREMFDQAFRMFWRDPKLLERMMSLLLPPSPVGEAEDKEKLNRRVAEALHGNRPPPERPERLTDENEETVDAVMTFSDREILQAKDFEQMSTEEY